MRLSTRTSRSSSTMLGNRAKSSTLLTSARGLKGSVSALRSQYAEPVSGLKCHSIAARTNSSGSGCAEIGSSRTFPVTLVPPWLFAFIRQSWRMSLACPPLPRRSRRVFLYLVLSDSARHLGAQAATPEGGDPHPSRPSLVIGGVVG